MISMRLRSLILRIPEIRSPKSKKEDLKSHKFFRKRRFFGEHSYSAFQSIEHNIDWNQALCWYPVTYLKSLLKPVRISYFYGIFPKWKYNIITVIMTTYSRNDNIQVTMKMQYHNDNNDNNLVSMKM